MFFYRNSNGQYTPAHHIKTPLMIMVSNRRWCWQFGCIDNTNIHFPPLSNSLREACHPDHHGCQYWDFGHKHHCVARSGKGEERVPSCIRWCHGPRHVQLVVCAHSLAPGGDRTTPLPTHFTHRRKSWDWEKQCQDRNTESHHQTVYQLGY